MKVLGTIQGNENRKKRSETNLMDPDISVPPHTVGHL